MWHKMATGYFRCQIPDNLARKPSRTAVAPSFDFLPLNTQTLGEKNAQNAPKRTVSMVLKVSNNPCEHCVRHQRPKNGRQPLGCRAKRSPEKQIQPEKMQAIFQLDLQTVVLVFNQ